MAVADSLPVPVGLALPDHVGRTRYRLPGVSGVGLLDRHGRPLLYTLDVGGRPVTVCNAIDERDRIPVDELHDMALDTARKRVSRGDAQKSADAARFYTDWWEDRKGWREDRRNGRVSVGPATFAGDRHR